MKPIVELKQHIESADITKQLDRYIYSEIRKVAVDVDEERLLKALSDAHSFYYEGYDDAAKHLYSRHEVACIIAELLGDDCACNFNGIDEWLPCKCELLDACPHPVGVSCWEQYLKHRGEKNDD